MSKEIYLHIKEPCHENWNAMSPAEQGRFCRSCAKRVIDFSGMNDRQILDILSKSTGNTCGRFTGNQLERPLVNGYIDIPFFLKPYKLVLSSLVPLFIVSVDAACQDKQVMGNTVMTVSNHDTIQGTRVKALKDNKHGAHPEKSEQLTVKRKILSEDDEPLPYATIKGFDKSITTDSGGTFSMMEAAGKEGQTSATHTGYNQVITNSCLKKELDTITVVGYTQESMVMIAGGLSIVKTVSAKDTLKTLVQKLFNNDLFTVFPNPVSKGQTLHIRFKKEGDYAIQLFDNAGRLYVEKQLSAGTGVDHLLPLPPAPGSGIFYLKGTNTTTKKQFTEKIIVP